MRQKKTKTQRQKKTKTAGDHSFGTVLLNKSLKECSFSKLMEKMQLSFTYVLCHPFLLRACLYLGLASFGSTRAALFVPKTFSCWCACVAAVPAVDFVPVAGLSAPCTGLCALLLYH